MSLRIDNTTAQPGRVRTDELCYLRQNSINQMPLPSTQLNQFILKPPSRFRDDSVRDNDHSVSNTADYPAHEKNDKVVVILQNILRNLENDIEHDRSRLKEERRRRQRERRRRREERRHSKMTASRATSTRHEFSTVPHKSFTFREGIGGGSIDKNLHIFRRDVGEIRKHDSFRFANMVPRSRMKEQSECFIEQRTRSSDRRLIKRTESYGVSDWSRYARSSDNINDAETDNCDDNSSQTTLTEPSDVNCANFNETKADAEPEKSNRRPESQRVSLSNCSAQVLDSHKIDNNSGYLSEAQITPTNIRRKLKSFEVLPNFKKNGKEISKSTENEIINQEASECGSVSVPYSPHTSVDETGKWYEATSGDDDDLDIVFPPTERKDRNQYRGVKFYVGKDSDDETVAEGYAEDAVSREPVAIRHYDGAVARFRKKQRLPCAGTGVVGQRDTERPTSAGTSGYSTDEYSCKTTDSEDEGLRERKQNERAQRAKQGRNLKKYFLVLQNGMNMALRVDESTFQNGDPADESCRSFLQNISMSDLAIPDNVGWLVDQSEQSKVWGVVVDMLFCVFEGESSTKPRDVIILPGCNIRPLVYNTAINGLHTNSHSQTITGICKFQFVIDDSSSGRKHVFGVESQNDLDTWYRVLKKASALDADVTHDMSTSNDSDSSKPTNRRLSFDGVLPNIGYMPSQDSTRRSQRMRSPRGAYEKPDTSGNFDETSGSTNGQESNGNQPSPRSAQGLVRNDSRRQSISEFKKRLRQETKPEVSKQLPVKATHFKQPTQNGNSQSTQNGKKLRSFGSFESLLKFKRKKSKSSEDSISNDDGGSIVSAGSVVSSSSTEQDIMTRSVDISAHSSQLQKKRGKKLSRSLELSEPKNGVSNGIVRRASDIKDRVFNRRTSKPYAKLGDLHDTSMHGFLLHKHHLKWQKLWCVVCRGCFYGFKSNSPEESALIAVLLANCGVIFVSQHDKKQKHSYIFKLSQERSKSIYLSANDYRELMKWLTVLQMESNSVISNADKIRKSSESENDSICSSLSSQSGSVLTVSSNEQPAVVESSRSRSKKKKAPAKPPRQFRNSSCPPAVTRESGSSTGEETLTSGSISSSADNANSTYGSTEDLPRYDKAVSHVWQNDRGYLFNTIRAKLSAYRKKDESIYNKDLPGAGNEGLLVVQDGAVRKGSRDVRRSRSFNAQSSNMSGEEQTVTPVSTESPTHARKRHKPLVVKKIAATDLEETIAGYIEKKSVSAQWIRYWYVLHEGTLFCYLTSDDNVTVDVLNLHGYSVTSLVDKFRGKRFVVQLSHEKFTSVYLSMESREDMENWRECLEHAIQQPSSAMKEADTEQGACAGCESNRQDEVGEKRKQVKQKLLEEMLRQKYELERKQAQRQKKQRSKGFDSPDRSPSSPYPPDFLADEQRTSDVTRLRQRRMSTQLKVETIQKQIEKPSGTKRGLFGFGKSKKLDENKNVFLQDQLKELNDKLQKIDTDLNHVESEKYSSESYDVNQNRKSMPVSVTSVNSVECGLEDDDIRQSTSIKNAMQKWTNKTFSKVSVKRRQADNGTLPLNESLPTAKQNGEIDMNGSLENGVDSETNQGQNSLDNSVTDLTRPLADLKLDLNLPLTQNSQSGSASPSLVGYNRSNSRTSTLSSLSSPRREIDPSVLAEIDAFEELTRQVLGARSKETPTK